MKGINMNEYHRFQRIVERYIDTDELVRNKTCEESTKKLMKKFVLDY